MKEVEHVVSAQCELGEGPLWHPVEQVLYWLDIYQHRLHRYDPSADQHDVMELGLMASAMGIRKNGGFVMATRNGFALWNPSSRAYEFLCDPDPDKDEEVRFNDGKTDPQGRFWAGKMSGEPSGSLFRLDPDGTAQRMESGITISNGLGWSPDGSTFYFTDTPTRTIVAYSYDPSSGAISGKRLFAEIPETPGEGFPDGLAVDSEGCVWSARWGGWKVVRYDPAGKVMEEVRLPVELVTSCAFGGPDLEDLYITSAWTEVAPESRSKQPLAGDVFRVRAGVRGMPEPFYMG